MKPVRRQFATVAQRQAWKVDCERKAARRMLARLMRQVSRLAREPMPPDQRRLADEYRAARRAHLESLRRKRDADDSERVKVAMDELQMSLGW